MASHHHLNTQNVTDSSEDLEEPCFPTQMGVMIYL